LPRKQNVLVSTADTICFELSHPGRQAPVSVTLNPVAPSNTRLKPGGRGWLATGTYCTPRALSTKEIYTIISKFKKAAKIAEEAGFSGIQKLSIFFENGAFVS